MIIRPNNISRRGFLRNVLGIGTAIVLPYKPTTQVLRGMGDLLYDTLYMKLISENQRLVQEAIDAVNDFTRTKMREVGFYRRVMPSLARGVYNAEFLRKQPPLVLPPPPGDDVRL